MTNKQPDDKTTTDYATLAGSEELEFHLEMQTRRYIEEGLDATAARAKALARLGDMHAAARESQTILHDMEHTMRRRSWFRGVGQDLRHAVRVLRRSPGYVAIAVVMLALGTGASAAVFSVVDGVILRSAFLEPDLMGHLGQRQPNGQLSYRVSTELYARLAANSPPAIVALGTHTISSPIVRNVDVPRRTQVECLSGGMPTVVGTRPMMGRWFGPDEAGPNAAPVAVVSARFWRGTLRSDADVLGRTITLDHQPVTLIGVMPPGFDGPVSRLNRDIWVPYDPLSNTAPFGCRPSAGAVNAMSRIRSGASMDTAARALNAAAGMDTLVLAPMVEETVGDLRSPFNALLGAVLAVLLIAFANVTNLSLERLAGRRRELAIRVALGATSGRIVRETVAEHLMVSLVGALAGVGLAMVMFDAMIGLLPETLPNLAAVSLNIRVLLASVLLALLGGAIAGLVTAFTTSAGSFKAGLESGDRGHTRSSTVTRRLFVASELALGVLLLVGALLMIRTFLTLRPSEPGFDPTGKYIALVRLAANATTAERMAFYQTVSDGLLATPGIRGVAGTTSVPMRRSVALLQASVGNRRAEVYTGAVTPNYFDLMGVPIRRGRGLRASDTAGSTRVALVNEAFVRAFFPDREPLGQTITLRTGQDRSETFRVAGVIGDIRSFGGDTRIRPFMYMPMAQSILGNAFLVIHAEPRAAAVLPATIRDAVARTRPDLLVDEVERLLDEMNAEVARPRLGAWLFGLFAGLAVVLGAVGLAATLAWSVAQRQREIGVRMALGARPGDVRNLVVGQMLRLSLSGIAVGLVAAAASTRLLDSWLYGITPLDPPTFAACSVAMLVVSAIAAYVPTRRATLVDPVVTLRGDG